MLRSATAILLTVTVLTANFSRLFIYAGFGLNQEYIASKLCENRDKPVLKCNGKCFLAKKIKQEEEKEKRDEGKSGKNYFQEAVLTQTITLNFPFRFNLKAFRAELPFNLPQRSSLIFHPPQV